MLSFSHLQQAALFASLSAALFFLVSLTLSLCLSSAVYMYVYGWMSSRNESK